MTALENVELPLIYRKTEEGKYLVGIAKRIINKFIHIKKNA